MLQLLLCRHALLPLYTDIARQNILDLKGRQEYYVSGALQLTWLPFDRHAEAVRLSTCDEHTRTLVQIKLRQGIDGNVLAEATPQE